MLQAAVSSGSLLRGQALSVNLPNWVSHSTDVLAWAIQSWSGLQIGARNIMIVTGTGAKHQAQIRHGRIVGPVVRSANVSITSSVSAPVTATACYAWLPCAYLIFSSAGYTVYLFFCLASGLFRGYFTYVADCVVRCLASLPYRSCRAGISSTASSTILANRGGTPSDRVAARRPHGADNYPERRSSLPPATGSPTRPRNQESPLACGAPRSLACALVRGSPREVEALACSPLEAPQRPSPLAFHLVMISAVRQHATEDRLLGLVLKSPRWPDETLSALVRAASRDGGGGAAQK